MKIKVEISARHIHLSWKDLAALFGKEFRLTALRILSQGQFAAKETLTLSSDKGKIENVRIVGPEREISCVVLSKCDAYFLDIKPPICDHSKAQEGAAIYIFGPQGQIKTFAVIDQRHIHLDPITAEKLNLEDGKTVSVKTAGRRAITFHNVLIRVSPKYKPAFHLDVDEANAAGVKSGDISDILL